ncbi:cellulose synthase-like protein G3 [Zingiber officinale]|uniref:cellulose synthase-like protein G3 n=1 Tax=Zingiber officinale TaxID=94328 RepID=UPI001C4B62B6|nr:cellulose synthase-like protein G3 [Zingiber officinale]
MTSLNGGTAFHSLHVSRFATLLFRAHALLLHHFLYPSSVLLLAADLVLSFLWASAVPFRWCPVRRKEFPDSLLREVGRDDLPAIDVFVCTADPRREPPASVASTALSAMAFDYPTDRLSVYLSDDGGSAVTLFAFMEAARFARYWLPFCKENAVVKRSPEVYFEEECSDEAGSKNLKRMYENMKDRIGRATERNYISKDLVSDEEELEIFKRWKGFSRNNHPTIIKVLLENGKDVDIAGNSLPNLIYVSREKSPASHHHYKAGALNVLTRVSGALSNAPIVLTLDCDTFSNDPRAPLRALCYFLDPSLATDLAFVQFPQRYQGINEDDIYASRYMRFFRFNPRGMDGLRGPSYVGTGCFFARVSLHGDTKAALPISSLEAGRFSTSEGVLKKAHGLAKCDYEDASSWGSTIGFRYGSLVEDFHTGYRLHCEGWRSVFCNPERAAFVGEVPKNLNDAISQMKRCVVGLYEVGFSRHTPLSYGVRKASFPVGLFYAHCAFLGVWCVPLMIYGLLPQLALINRVPLFPKVSDPWFFVYAYLFLAAYLCDLLDFLVDGVPFRRWWNDQRIWLIRGPTSYLFGTLEFLLNSLSVSAPGFNLTSKVTEEEQAERYARGYFDFAARSPFFGALAAVAVVNLSAVAVGIKRVVTGEVEIGEFSMQLALCGFVAVNCWPIYGAMFWRRDGGRMPVSVTAAATAVAGLLHMIAHLAFAFRG